MIKLLQLQTGNGKNGIWKKQEFIVETAGQVPRKICFSLWGDKIDQANLSEGDEAEVMFDLESREYNGRWYTEAKAWKVSRKSAGSSKSAPMEEPPPEYYSSANDEGLPF